MEYHYPDICVPTDHLLNDPYTAEYGGSYVMANQGDAEYEVRGSVLVDGGDRFGVSSVVFDKYEELVWMGNQGGHVTSYYGPTLQKYTSFQVHESEGIRDIVTAEQSLFILTKSILRKQIRRGIPKHTFRSPNMTDMQCLFQVSPTNLLMGGHQDKLLDLDLNQMKETIVTIPEEGCAVLRSGGGSTVACGSASGSVTLRDLRCPQQAQHTFRAHAACLSDLDMQGNLLISCGFGHAANGCAEAEPYVVVWDARRLRAAGGGAGGAAHAWMAHTAAPPLLLHFLPAFSGRAAALSGDGHVTLLSVSGAAADSSDHSVFQVDSQNSQCSAMDVSSSSQALVFGDQGGRIHLYSPQHNHEPVFNNFSRETEFADQELGLPIVNFSDTTFQFSRVPLPPLTTGSKWFNELPKEFFKRTYRKPKPIDPEVLSAMKMQGPIGYAPNPRTFKRNQMPYVEDTLEDLNSPKTHDNRTSQPIPRPYQKVDSRYKHGSEVDQENCNPTGLPGLEATIPNSYCNPMLQVLYYTGPVKSMIMSHTCAKEFCLSCELGFLFRMLDTSCGSPCHAGNFLRAFRTVPEAAALGLILPDRGSDQQVELVGLIQSWNRFILHQLHYEILDTRKKEKEIALLKQNASSPPKPSSRLGNPPIASKGSLATPQMNGHFEEFKYAELDFLGPSTDLEGQEGAIKENGWQVNAGVIEGKNVIQSGSKDTNENADLSNSRQVNKEDSDISQLFGIGRHQWNRCLKCNKEEERESVVLASALQYPAPVAVKDTTTGWKGFIPLLLASLSSKRSTPAWCDHCRKFSPTLQQATLIRLPPVLAINCGGVTAHEKAYWSKGTQKDVPDMKRGGSGKPCRYGLHCARPGCRFKHPDRPGSAPQNGQGSPTREPHCALPTNLHIKVSADGDIVINDKTEQPGDESPAKSESGKSHAKFSPLEERYSLSGAVVCVEDSPRRLVAYVRSAAGHWALCNDESVTPVSEEEVVQLRYWWKTVCVLVYCARSVLQTEPGVEVTS